MCSPRAPPGPRRVLQAPARRALLGERERTPVSRSFLPLPAGYLWCWFAASTPAPDPGRGRTQSGLDPAAERGRGWCLARAAPRFPSTLREAGEGDPSYLLDLPAYNELEGQVGAGDHGSPRSESRCGAGLPGFGPRPPGLVGSARRGRGAVRGGEARGGGTPGGRLCSGPTPSHMPFGVAGAAPSLARCAVCAELRLWTFALPLLPCGPRAFPAAHCQFPAGLGLNPGEGPGRPS